MSSKEKPGFRAKQKTISSLRQTAHCKWCTKSLQECRGLVLRGQCKHLLLLQDHKLVFSFQIRSFLSRICWKNTDKALEQNLDYSSCLILHFLRKTQRKEEKIVENEWNWFLKVIKLHHSYWLLSYLNFTERSYQDIKNIPTGHIKGITQDHWLCKQQMPKGWNASKKRK